VNDALPILKLAQRVEVLAKHHPGSLGEEGEPTSLSAHLARHGVAAKVSRLLAGDAPWGDVLLNRVCDDGFDLLVMGASSPGQEGKVALGSVARHLLREMTVPVLMSH
jgi:nucleotide-binding universal stress UspA family protein